MLSQRDIETKEFGRSKVGGYKPEEVDNFLDEILVNYNALLEEREVLNKKIAVLNEKIETYREEQDQWKNTILNTQKSYDEVIKNAKKKADKLVFDAQDYAKKLIEAAKAETDYQQEIKKRLATEVEEFKTKLISIYESHVKLISSIPIIKKDTVPFQSDTLDMLKMATAESSGKETSEIKNNIVEDDEEAENIHNDSEVVQEEYQDRAEDSIRIDKHKEEIHEKIDNASSAARNYEDLVFDLRDNDDDVKTSYSNFQSRSRKPQNEKDISKSSRLILDDDDEKENKIKGLFEEDDKKTKSKSLFGGKGNKKSLKLFGKDDDDDDEYFDDDDDYYDDDDE